MTADRHLALSNSTGWNFTKASGAGAGSSQQVLPLYPRVSPSISLHNAQMLLLLFLSHLSTLHLHIEVVPTMRWQCSWWASG